MYAMKNKVCTKKQISQNKNQNRLCSLKNRNIKKKNLIVVELLIPPKKAQRRKKQKDKKKQPEVHQII